MYLVVEFNIMVNNMDRKNLEFASLLHDIGKFHQRTGDKVTGKYSEIPMEKHGRNGAHAKWSADFLSKFFDEDIIDLALHHHNPNASNYPKLCQMLQKADHHSSTERITSGEANDTSLTPLISIFSEVKIGDNKESEEYYVPFKKIDLNEDSFEDLKPKISSKEIMVGWNLKPEYKQLWAEFANEITNLKHFNFNTTLALMKKYASTIPSAVYVSVPDISLYDHSKTTAALAVCRYLFDRDCDENLTQTNHQNVYLAINGDISGIQKFIFKISSPQEAQSGMSKRLRGRSLYLTLLTNAIADKIAQELELTSANILFCGGGRFTIIAPNTENAKVKLEEIKNKVNEEFIEKFNAELYLAIATEECCAIKDPKDNESYDLNNFGKLMKHLTDLLTEDKKHKFVDNLKDVFNFDEEIIYDDICSVCGKLYHKENEDDFVCPSCKSHESLGQKVANSNYMIKVFLNDEYDFKDAKRDFAFSDEYLKVGYNFFRSYKSGSDLIKFIEKLDMFADKFEVIKLNDTDFLEFANEFDDLSLEKISFSFSFIGNTVPKYPKEGPLYFEHLAQISKGSNKLGILKMDVDNLGQIFSSGFDQLLDNSNSEEFISGMSISRMSTLSSQLDLFFSGFVNDIASNYVVYSDIDALNLDESAINNKFKKIDLKLQNDNVEDEFITVYKAKSELDLEERRTLKRWEIPTIYINFSGGDDLLVLGPYDDIIEFAGELRSKFKQWTCDNDSINLSAGISIVSPKFPIGKAANMAEDYLGASKSCGKDKICVFGEVVNWDDNGLYKGFNSLLDFGLELEEYNRKSKVSKGLIYSMLNMCRGSFEESPDIIDDEDEWNEVHSKRLSTKKYVPLFKYKLRLIKDKEVRKDLDKKGIKFMPWIKIPVSWVSLRMREVK